METQTEKRAPYDHNTATLPNDSTSNVRNRNDKRERVGTLRVVVFDKAKRGVHDDGFREVLTARFYMGRSSSASTVYCDLWASTRDGERYFSGSGSAGGYGYHKMSAAFDEALTNAGIKLERSCSGCGDGPMRLAAESVAKAAGYSRLPIHTFHD